MAVFFAKSCAILFNFFAFIITIIFNKEATKISRVFPIKTGEVSNRFNTEITPAGATFAIWGVIYLWQGSWIAYSLSLLFRPSAADILPTWFYLFYTLSCVFNVSWLVVWARQLLRLSSVILVLITLSLESCLFFAYTSLYTYLQDVPADSQNQTDVWCVRFLVQNGVMFYMAWVTIASCLNFTIYMQYGMKIHKSRAAKIGLVILLTIVILWFAVENILLEKYFRYTFTEYIVLIIGLSGILKKQWTDGKGNQAFVLFILVISGLMFGARLMIISVPEK